MTNYLSLEKLKTYNLARKLGDIVWIIFEQLDLETKKIFGYQFVESTESIGANISEGYGRYHFLDKAKFYYNARGSLIESRHWFDVLIKRNKLTNNKLINTYLSVYKELRLALNGLIKSIFNNKGS
ncbi:MAG: four helix bundle protein [Candidatus Microgenomates bacterium]